VFPAHEHEVAGRLDHDGADLHPHSGGDHAERIVVGDVPFERQHDADAGYEADAVTALARAGGILTARGQFAHAQGRPEQPRTPRSALALGLIALVAALGVAALGVWQLERRVQKLDLIDRVAQRSSAAPIAAPGPAAWPRITEADDAYRRVRATGRFLGDGEVLVKAVTELGGGFW